MEMISKIQVWITIITSIGTFIGIVFVIYKTFTGPDIKAAQNIALLKQGCELKHNRLNENIAKIEKMIEKFEENHMNHIEPDIRLLRENQVKIFQILNERLPKKQ